MMADLYLARHVVSRLNDSVRRTKLSMNVWQVGRGANSCVAIQYNGTRWVEAQELRDAVKQLARDNNLALNINMEQYR